MRRGVRRVWPKDFKIQIVFRDFDILTPNYLLLMFAVKIFFPPSRYNEVVIVCTTLTCGKSCILRTGFIIITTYITNSCTTVLKLVFICCSHLLSFSELNFHFRQYKYASISNYNFHAEYIHIVYLLYIHIHLVREISLNASYYYCEYYDDRNWVILG